MRRSLGFIFAVLAMALAMPLAAVRAADKSDKDDPAPNCHGVDMLAETAARDPQTYNRIMAEAAATKNAGAIFWTDIFVPIIGIVLLYLQSNSTRQAERGVRNAPAKR